MLYHPLVMIVAVPFLGAVPAPGLGPIEIHAEVFLPMALVDGLQELTIRNDGTGTLRVSSFIPNKATNERIRERKIALSKEQLAKIKMAIDDAQFFSLPENVGSFVYDTAMCTVTVKRGDKTHKVTLWWPYDPKKASKENLECEQRAKNVWRAVWLVEAFIKDRPVKAPK